MFLARKYLVFYVLNCVMILLRCVILILDRLKYIPTTRKKLLRLDLCVNKGQFYFE